MPANCAFTSVYGSLTAFARIPHHAPPLRGQTGLRRRSEVGLTPQAAASRGNTNSLSNPALNILHQIVDPRVTNFAGVYFLGNIERSGLAVSWRKATPSQPAFQSDMRDTRRLCVHERLWGPSWHLLEYRTTRHRCRTNGPSRLGLTAQTCRKSSLEAISSTCARARERYISLRLECAEGRLQRHLPQCTSFIGGLLNVAVDRRCWGLSRACQ